MKIKAEISHQKCTLICAPVKYNLNYNYNVLLFINMLHDKINCTNIFLL